MLKLKSLKNSQKKTLEEDAKIMVVLLTKGRKIKKIKRNNRKR